MGIAARKLMDAPAGGGYYSCTITVGSAGGFLGGYDTGFFTTIGSIDAEPIPGEVLGACIWYYLSTDYLAVSFLGDLTSIVGSLDVWLGGVNYGGNGSWVYNGGGDTTVYENNTVGPAASSGTMFFELK